MANKNQLKNIGYLDFEFIREGSGQLRPTELGLAWWGGQYLYCKSLTFLPTIQLKEVRKAILKTISNYETIKTLVFWDKTQDKQILKDSGLNLSKYSFVDLQDELGKTTLDKISKQYSITPELIIKHIFPNQRKTITKLSLHTGIGDALRIALIHQKVSTITTTQTITKTTIAKKTTLTTANTTKSISQNVQLFQYLDTLDLSVLLIERRISQKTALTLWKSAVLDNPHLNIPYDSFLLILKAHLLSLI